MADDLQNNGTDNTEDTDLMAETEDQEDLQQTIADSDGGQANTGDTSPGTTGTESGEDEESSEEEAV